MNDFKGGLVTNQPSCELELNQSPDLDNIVLMNNGFRKRNGDVAFNATTMGSGKAVLGLGYWKSVAGVEYLMSICDTKIFKSDSMDGTMDDISAALTITYNANNIWTFSVLKDLAIFVGGAPNPPIKWSGTGDAALLGGTPPNGDFGFVTHDRLFIGIASTAVLYWCILSNPDDWSGTGSGNTTIVTSDGDILVCGVPINNDVTLLLKQYSIHTLNTNSAPFPVKPLVQGLGCCGKLAAINVGGLVYFISKEPRMYVTDGYSFTKINDKIDDIWDGLKKDRLKYIQGVYFPVLNQIHWYCSYGTSTSNNYCIIWDISNKCWIRYTTSAKVNVAYIAQGYRLFGGSYDGKIYEKEYATTYSDSSETSPGIITGYWKTPYINLKNNLSVKQARYTNISYKTQTTGVIKYSYGYDFGLQNTGSLSQLQTGGKWGIDTWNGSFIWGGQEDKQANFFMFGRGNNLQLKIYNDNEDETYAVNSATIAMKEQGVKEFAAK
jgi:hypothetical protein